MISTNLSSNSLIHSSASCILPLITYSKFLILAIVLFISVYFKSSSSLLKLLVLYCSVPPFFSPEFLDHLYYHSLGRLPISTSLSCSSGVLSCSFVWNIFLCQIITSFCVCAFSSEDWRAIVPLASCVCS